LFHIGKGELDSAAKNRRCVCNTDQQIPDASSTSLHRTEMLYNVEQLNEIVTEYIIQDVKEFDEKLISLHCRVQKLTNHVALLQKKMNKSVRMPVMVVRLKCHSIIVSMRQ
jgi:hypothetical protein